MSVPIPIPIPTPDPDTTIMLYTSGAEVKDLKIEDRPTTQNSRHFDEINTWELIVNEDLSPVDIKDVDITNPTRVYLGEGINICYLGSKTLDEIYEILPQPLPGTNTVRVFLLEDTGLSTVLGYFLKIKIEIQVVPDPIDTCIVFANEIEYDGDVGTKKLKRGTVTVVQTSKGDTVDPYEK